MNRNPILYLLLFFVVACELEDLEKINFLDVTIDQFSATTINQLAVQGEIIGLTTGRIEEHGLVWTSADLLPTINLRDSLTRLGPKTLQDTPQFLDTIRALQVDTRYIIRAYAMTDNEIEYSDTIVFTTGRGSVMTQDPIYDSGFSIQLTGQLMGMEAGILATSHGFCWSTTVDDPVLGGCCEVIDLGNRTNNDPFFFDLAGIENGSFYYIQAFAVLRINGNLDTLYGGVKTFDGNLNDFWLQAGDDPRLRRCDGVAFSLGNKAYLGTGWDGSQPLNDFWEYDPATNTWDTLPNVPGPARTDAVGFAIEETGKIYIGMGWNGSTSQGYTDFYEYDPATNIWTPMPEFSSPLGGRSNAVSFAIGSKGYICTGFDDNFEHSAECWEFNPNGAPDSIWVKKASLGKGRVDAAAFTLDGKGYVLTGWQSNTLEPFFKDFWEFDPSIAPDGKWTQKHDFPGAARIDAVAFAMESSRRGYITTGWATVNFQLNDLWEYNPLTDEWQRKADLPPDQKLRNAAGFAIDDLQKAFVGTGGLRTRIASCDSLQYQFWEYDSN